MTYFFYRPIQSSGALFTQKCISHYSLLITHFTFIKSNFTFFNVLFN